MQERIKAKVSIQRSKINKVRFIDRIRVRAQGGNGGSGCNSFVCVAPGKKRPNGGHGGQGGHVFVQADEKMTSFNSIRHHMRGGDGQHGQGITYLDSLIELVCSERSIRKRRQ